MVHKKLGEIALRTTQMDVMTAFYEDVVQLDRMNYDGEIAFFKVADGFAGHTQILALFPQQIPIDDDNQTYDGLRPRTTTLHHIAFAIDLVDYDTEKQRLESLGYEPRTAVHNWVKWRSLYISDPDGNTVEWVCYDAVIDAQKITVNKKWA